MKNFKVLMLLGIFFMTMPVTVGASELNTGVSVDVESTIKFNSNSNVRNSVSNFTKTYVTTVKSNGNVVGKITQNFYISGNTLGDGTTRYTITGASAPKSNTSKLDPYHYNIGYQNTSTLGKSSKATSFVDYRYNGHVYSYMFDAVAPVNK